ncbi:MAG: hypothetical protein ACI9WV_002536, partial [Patiriisocius sp.]
KKRYNGKPGKRPEKINTSSSRKRDVSKIHLRKAQRIFYL